MRPRDRPLEFSTRKSQPDREMTVFKCKHLGGEFVEKTRVKEKSRFLIFGMSEDQEKHFRVGVGVLAGGERGRLEQVHGSLTDLVLEAAYP